MWLTEKYIDSDGRELILDIYHSFRYYKLNHKHHRLDGPAVIFDSGNFYWYRNGSYHRIGGPAYYDSIYYLWFLGGKRVEVYYIYG